MVGIVATGYEVLNKNRDLPILSTAIALLLISIILIAVLALFYNLKQEEAYVEAKTVFISVASHDLHSPLTGINWAASALASEIKEPKQHERLLAIEQSSRLMMQTVDDALSITSLDHLAKQKVNLAQADLLELVDGVINSFKLTAAQKSVIMQRIGKWPSVYPVMVDEKQFRRVIANIMSNEIKFTSPNTAVSLTFSETASNWSIAIHNDGPSIAPADQNRIFELHGRSEKTEKAGDHGQGFGLYLAQQIILKHNGSISVDPAQNKGVTFIIIMPKIT
jgi:signal transduction histidine kinase